jgi:hypothetical protein
LGILRYLLTLTIKNRISGKIAYPASEYRLVSGKTETGAGKNGMITDYPDG